MLFEESEISDGDTSRSSTCQAKDSKEKPITLSSSSSDSEEEQIKKRKTEGNERSGRYEVVIL